MAVIAVYSVKGGVGKTTLAVSLAWSAATTSCRRTLLWDLDPQGGSGYLLGLEPGKRMQAAGILSREVDPARAIRPTGIDRLDLLPADDSLRGLDSLFQRLGKRRRLAKLLEELSATYERIVLDCAPGLDETSAQILRAAGLVVVPLPPSPLARRALETIRDELSRNHKRHPPLLPVLSMVDARRRIHREVHAEFPDWPVIPMASQIEQIAVRRAPIGTFAASSEPARALERLWAGIERRLVAP